MIGQLVPSHPWGKSRLPTGQYVNAESLIGLINHAQFQVKFSCDAVADCYAFLDSTPPQITGGYGGWTVTNRERRVGLTQWQGKDPIRMALSIIFDGVITDQGQE